MLLDLVSPWCAAVEATASAQAEQLFRDRNAGLLDMLRRKRSPSSDVFPLAGTLSTLRPLARRAADPGAQQRLRDLLARAAELGAGGCTRVILLAGDGTGEPAELVPWPDGTAILFLDVIADDRDLVRCLAGAVAALTRWRSTDSRCATRPRETGPWNRWQFASDVPLREPLYIEGLGVHLLHALVPNLLPHEALGIRRTMFNRLREREKFFTTLLTHDLDAKGVGLLLRWLTPAAPPGPRTVAGTIVPPFTGRYLAWRMLSERVNRAGLREAIRMEA